MNSAITALVGNPEGCPETFYPCGSIAAAGRFAVTIRHESRGLALLLERPWIERLSRERLLRP